MQEDRNYYIDDLINKSEKRLDSLQEIHELDNDFYDIAEDSFTRKLQQTELAANEKSLCMAIDCFVPAESGRFRCALKKDLIILRGLIGRIRAAVKFVGKISALFPEHWYGVS